MKSEPISLSEEVGSLEKFGSFTQSQYDFVTPAYIVYSASGQHNRTPSSRRFEKICVIDCFTEKMDFLSCSIDVKLGRINI
jgi:hypothetical protein